MESSGNIVQAESQISKRRLSVDSNTEYPPEKRANKNSDHINKIYHEIIQDPQILISADSVEELRKRFSQLAPDSSYSCKFIFNILKNPLTILETFDGEKEVSTALLAIHTGFVQSAWNTYQRDMTDLKKITLPKFCNSQLVDEIILFFLTGSMSPMSKEKLISLLETANYLNSKPLMDLCDARFQEYFKAFSLDNEEQAQEIIAALNDDLIAQRSEICSFLERKISLFINKTFNNENNNPFVFANLINLLSHQLKNPITIDIDIDHLEVIDLLHFKRIPLKGIRFYDKGNLGDMKSAITSQVIKMLTFFEKMEKFKALEFNWEEDIPYVEIVDNLIKEIVSEFPLLETLKIDCVDCSEISVELADSISDSISKLSSLKSLDLAINEGMIPMKKILSNPNLEKLVLDSSGKKLGVDEFQCIHQMKNLKSFSYDNLFCRATAEADDDDCIALLPLKLEHLELKGSNLTDISLKRIGEMPLKHLTLDRCSNMTVEGLKNLPNDIEELRISTCFQHEAGDSAFDIFLKMPRLRRLTISQLLSQSKLDELKKLRPCLDIILKV